VRLSSALQAQRTPYRGQKNVVRSVPAPVGGWNASDSLDEMAENEAVILTNWFPGQGQVSLRKGSTSHATGMSGSVEMISEFNAGSTRKLIAAANGNIWNATSASAASSLGSGFASDRWQWAQFDDSSGGARVGYVNGSDDPQYFDGTSLAAMTISGTGLTASNLDGINIFKGRSYFWDSGTQDFWYSAVNALGGSLSKFPLGRVAGTGGNLIAMGTWTRDGGSGPDDLAAFVLSSGDVVIYAGDNPGDSNAWALVGIFKIGAPLGIRAVTKIGSDLIVATVDGYLPMSKVLDSARASPKQAISDKIRKAVLSATSLYSGNFGWQIVHYPLGNYALVNVPVSSNTFDQHVVNTETGAWTKFHGMNAHCWGMFNDRLYFGGSGVIYKADDSKADSGAAISGTAQTAWTYLGSRASQKRFTAVKPLLQVSGSLSFNAGIGVDFKAIRVAKTDSSPTAISTPWGSPWGSPWADTEATNENWLSAEGIGYNASCRIEVLTSTRSVDWFSTQYMFESGRGSF